MQREPMVAGRRHPEQTRRQLVALQREASPTVPRAGKNGRQRHTTPGGRPIFHMFGALGQFERDLIRERAGLTAAAARGRNAGRKPIITDDKLKQALGTVGKGLTARDIATRLTVRKTVPYAALRTDMA